VKRKWLISISTIFVTRLPPGYRISECHSKCERLYWGIDCGAVGQINWTEKS
jgi:hypothetical protein